MVGTLFAKISDALGKSFLFAGLLPAAVLLVGLAAYFGFGTGAVLGELKAETIVGELALAAGIWLAAGLVLFAAGGPVTSFAERMPGGWLGRRLMARHLRRRDVLAAALRRIEWRLTVAEWWRTGFALAEKPERFRPPGTDVPGEDEAVAASHRALRCLRRLPVGSVHRRQAETDGTVVDGLARLYLLGVSTATARIGDELRVWRRVAREPAISAALEAIRGELLRQAGRTNAALDAVPEGPWMRATALGNRLGSVDDYAKRRYGIETAVLWSRLWWILPAAAKNEVSDAKLYLETMVNVTLALAGVAAIAAAHGLVCLAGGGAEGPWRSLVFFAAGAGLAAVAYRGAVLAVEVLAQKTVGLIDIYRFKVLAAFGYVPATVADESAMFAELQLLLAQAAARPPGRTLKVDPKAKNGDGKEQET